MALSRKNYEAVAAIVASVGPAPTHAGDSSPYVRGFGSGAASSQGIVADKLADYFASDNPRFDRARFLKACGVTG